MFRSRSIALGGLVAAGGLAIAGCGSGGGAPASSPTASAATTATRPATSAATPPGALTPESASAATGDIPDNQVFLSFHNAAAGYAMKYPEGWARTGAGRRVTFRDKNNLIRVTVDTGGLPTTSAASAELKGGPARVGPAARVTVAGAPAVKLTYTTRSAPNPVTAKRVVLAVDRYYLAHAGRRAVVDLGTPTGVDNVDAYRLIIGSFRWR